MSVKLIKFESIFALSVLGLTLAGCERVERSTRERSVDEELSRGPVQEGSPSEAVQGTPRPGFEQEPSKAQQP